MSRNLRFRASVIALALGLGAHAVAAAEEAPAQKGAANQDVTELSVVVVTGVFGATKVERAPISIAAITNEQIQQQPPISSADLLKNVPGVFVNSALGEVRNVVFSRGVSANSLDGAGGYYYVSMQEDGLPVELITSTNFGPDYFSRPDIMLNHLEGLRGGTAVVTGPNAPGGIFNYISKTGKSDPGMQVQAKYGLEGDGKNPYYRIDGYAGGRIGDSDLYYAVGGFYRRSDGARNPGYPMNDGGQIRGNLLWKYDGGQLLLTAKYLDDHNGWFEFTPSFGGDDPHIAPGFSKTSSVLAPKDAAHCYSAITGGRRCWDPSNLVHSRELSFGANWNQDLGAGFALENRLRVSQKSADWNTGAVIFPLAITDFVVTALDGTVGLPGTFTYTNSRTGAVLATVRSVTGLDRQVVSSNLPGSDVLKNGGLTEAAFDQTFHARNFVDQITLTKEVGGHHLAVGGYASIARLSSTAYGAGLGWATLEANPVMMNVTYTTPGGRTYQVTDPHGFTHFGRLTSPMYSGDQDQYSLFVGDTWRVNDRLSLDIGARYETITYKLDFQNFTNPPGSILSTGGADGDPLTLYDNGINVPTAPYSLKRSFDFIGYSGSAAYKFTDQFDAYIRYTSGKKAPDFSIMAGLNTPGQIATVFPKPQEIEQVEIGLKYHRSGLDVQVFPFYSHLSNIATAQTFTYLSGPSLGQSYSPPPAYGEIKTYGVEVSANATLTDTLKGNAVLTLQNPKQSGYSVWTQGPKGDGSDDVLTKIPSGDADNNPKIMFRGGLTWRPVTQASVFGTVNYMGERAANNYNAFYLPAYTTVDVGASWRFNDTLKLQANINNLFDEFGVMSWARGGGFLNALDRQGLTKAAYQANPNQLLPVVPIQPRSFFVTLTATF